MTFDIDKEADRCVQCGLCLPHCPTYSITPVEGESPRGRIALMRALANGGLSASPTLVGHLDRCLGCRACEAVCPSGVHYGRLLDATQATLHAVAHHRQGGALVRRALLFAVGRRAWLHGAARLLRGIRRIGLGRLLPRAGDYLPTQTPPLPWLDYYAPPGALRGRVGLFIGCITSVMDDAALRDAVRVLNALGYGVCVPKAQTCCGALHHHGGDQAGALALAARNVMAFPSDVVAIVSIASGCGAFLSEYGTLQDWDATHTEGARGWAGRVQDISRFLCETAWPEDVYLEPLSATVAVHTPCSLRNVLHADKAPALLLMKLPQARVVALPGAHCCGGAGDYLLRQPALAAKLRATKCAALDGLAADWLATSNTGCALQLRDCRAQDGPQVRVAHPVSLIARQLRRR